MRASTLRSGIRWICVAVLVLATSCEAPLPTPAAVGSVRIVNPPATLQVGESVRLSAMVLDPSGEPLRDVAVFWGTLDPTVVDVDSVSGVAHARTPGSARIVASSKNKRDHVDVVVPPGPHLAFNTIVMDELGATDDADEFTFDGITGQQVNVFLQGTSGAAGDQFRLRVIGPGGNALDSVTSRGTDAALRKQVVQGLLLPQNGTYRVRVEANAGLQQGRYQLMVETINPAPEKTPAAVTLGTAVTTESLSPGDIDNFTFSGKKGQDVSISFQARSGKAADALRLRLLTPGGTELRFVHSNGDYPTAQWSGRVQLPLDGVYLLRIQGLDAESQGFYDFQVFSINRAPEAAGIAAAIGTTVSNEALSPPGDVDEFTLSVTTQQEVNVFFRAASGSRADTMVVRVLTSTGAVLDSVTSFGDAVSVFGQAIGHLPLPTATYRIQVDGARATRGAYQLLVRSINLPPEAASAVVTYGVRVSTESISPVGDVDVFRFHGNVGDAIRIRFQATSRSDGDELRLYLLLPDGRTIDFVTAYGNQGEQTYTTVLPSTGDYPVRVRGVNSVNDAGPYWFQVDKTN